MVHANGSHTVQTVKFDAEKKIWKSPNYNYWDFVNQTLGEAFLKQMRSMDQSKVLEYYYDTGAQKTAGEIYRDAVTVAVNLKKLGIQKGDVVVLYSMNNPKISALTFGCLLIGAAVNFFETKLEKEHVDCTLQLLEPTVIFYEEQSRQDVQQSLERSKLPSLKHIISIDAVQAPNVESELLTPALSSGEIASFESVKLGDPQKETATLILTSGSTGLPKAVDLSHALMLHGMSTWWCEPSHQAELTADSVVFSFSPLRWVSQIAVMFQSLLFGLKRVCASQLPEGAYGRDIVRKGKITHFFTAPTIFQDILTTVAADDDSSALDSLKAVQLGGEPTSQIVMDLTNKMAKNCKAYRCYGMTEVSGCITNDPLINGGPLTPGLQIKVLDEDLRPLGANVSGQLCLKTPVPLKGYRKLDNSKYIFEDGFFLNGDYGYVDEHNNLHIEARYKDLVRTKNAVLVPNLLEVLVADLPEIFQARLVGYRKTASDSYETGSLFVVLHANVTEPHDSIRSKIRELLKMILKPEELDNIEDIHFIKQLPLTTCGKVSRVDLRTLASKM